MILELMVTSLPDMGNNSVLGKKDVQFPSPESAYILGG